MQASLANTDKISPDVWQMKLDVVRRKLSLAANMIFSSVHQRSASEQDRLCKEMYELESYIQGIFCRDETSKAQAVLKQDKRWVDNKIGAIVSLLGGARQHAKDF